ncbi:hypothetical protein SBBP1_400007 [Burkholderiales bacterium]|nr:hypothetical protein SBBP1_400007 [Burkholderiales bacterium]
MLRSSHGTPFPTGQRTVTVITVNAIDRIGATIHGKLLSFGALVPRAVRGGRGSHGPDGSHLSSREGRYLDRVGGGLG